MFSVVNFDNREKDMKPQNFTTERTEKRILRFKNSVNSEVFLAPKEFPLNGITERIISCAIEVHLFKSNG